jgi:hypothetical protein
MKMTKMFLVLLFLAVGTAFAQNAEREKVYKSVYAVVAAHDYNYTLQYVDVINGQCFNPSGRIVRFIDEEFKQRAVYTNKLVRIQMPPIDSCNIFIDGTTAMVMLKTRYRTDNPNNTENAEASFDIENALLLRRDDRKNWLVLRWMQIGLVKPVSAQTKRPPPKEFE